MKTPSTTRRAAKTAALPLHIAPIDTREPAYTPAEQAEIDREAARAAKGRVDATTWVLVSRDEAHAHEGSDLHLSCGCI